jgi:hypothetical protein
VEKGLKYSKWQYMAIAPHPIGQSDGRIGGNGRVMGKAEAEEFLPGSSLKDFQVIQQALINALTPDDIKSVTGRDWILQMI